MSQQQKRKKAALIAAGISTITALAIGLFFVPMQNTVAIEPTTLSENVKASKAIEIARNFVVSSPTFSFDGILDSLDMITVNPLESHPTQYVIEFAFESRHGGFGNRAEQMLTQVITPHTMNILVIDGTVISAVTDDIWDEMNHQYILKKLQSSNGPVKYFDDAVSDYVTFLEAVNSRGLYFELIEKLDDSSFSVPTRVVSISGIHVQVFEFESEQDAKIASSIVSDDGTEIGSSIIRWMDTPHFYTQGKIIVLYVGQNPEIQSLLDSLLGTQFAGM